MALLTVIATTDFSVQALNNITDVTFAAGAAATATFSASQFNNVTILNNVHWTGDQFANGIVVDGGSVDASAWEFTDWSLNDTITFTGTVTDDVFVASRQKDIVNGNRGLDTFVSGHSSQGDEFYGGRGTDTFLYLGFTTPITDIISGGDGTSDMIIAAEAGTYDFRGADISNVEKFAFGTLDQTSLFMASQFMASGIISVLGSTAFNTLEFHEASAINLSGVILTDWTGNLDVVRILGTAGNDQITGSAKADEIIVAGGTDTIDAGGGKDVIRIDETSSDSTIQGGAGVDTILLRETDSFVTNFASCVLSSIEVVAFDGEIGGQILARAAGSQFGTGKIETVRGSSGQDIIYINGSIDSSLIVLEDWTDGLDRVVFTGSAGDDVVTGTAYGDEFRLNTGTDILAGEGGDDLFEVGIETTNSVRQLDGGAGYDRLYFSGVAPNEVILTETSFTLVELVDFATWSGSLTLNADVVGGVNGIQEFDSGSSVGLNTLVLEGAIGDLSGIVFTGWVDDDLVRFSGTAGADAYTGSYVAEHFLGTLGADVYDGEGGDDEVDYSASVSAVSVDLQLATFSGGSADGDTLSDIEWITGSSHDDTIYGASTDNVLDGGLGNDTIRGRAGADTLIGGDGIDTLNYAGSTAGVVVSLSAGTASGGHAAGDLFEGFENISGTTQDDRLTGNAEHNVLLGSGGADRLNGGNGQDEMTGGGGLDVFLFGSTNHSQNGAATRDTITGFSQSAGSRDVLDLSTIDAQAGSSATNEAFTFVAAGGFTGEGQIIAVVSGADTIIRINTSGAGGAEMEVVLSGFAGAITAADFIL